MLIMGISALMLPCSSFLRDANPDALKAYAEYWTYGYLRTALLVYNGMLCSQWFRSVSIAAKTKPYFSPHSWSILWKPKCRISSTCCLRWKLRSEAGIAVKEHHPYRTNTLPRLTASSWVSGGRRIVCHPIWCFWLSLVHWGELTVGFRSTPSAPMLVAGCLTGIQLAGQTDAAVLNISCCPH